MGLYNVVKDKLEILFLVGQSFFSSVTLISHGQFFLLNFPKNNKLI